MDRYIHTYIDTKIQRYKDTKIHRLIHTYIHRSIDPYIHRYIVIPMLTFTYAFVYCWCLLINVDVYPWDIWCSKFLKLFYCCRVLISDMFHQLNSYDITLNHIWHILFQRILSSFHSTMRMFAWERASGYPLKLIKQTTRERCWTKSSHGIWLHPGDPTC